MTGKAKGRGEKVSLWAVEMLVATAEEGAITAAARRLGVSASAVSQQIVALEAALGAEPGRPHGAALRADGGGAGLSAPCRGDAGRAWRGAGPGWAWPILRACAVSGWA
ncbi:helix-turn-helix domain-containing protein [Rhodobacter capsulatus]|uniref:helix-turn-helix domain-containing protein n=1 Tax=Rhodobacter capsulatus TaxID=1061 RepID=UPI004024D0E9